MAPRGLFATGHLSRAPGGDRDSVACERCSSELITDLKTGGLIREGKHPKTNGRELTTLTKITMPVASDSINKDDNRYVVREKGNERYPETIAHVICAQKRAASGRRRDEWLRELRWPIR